MGNSLSKKSLLLGTAATISYDIPTSSAAETSGRNSKISSPRSRNSQKSSSGPLSSPQSKRTPIVLEFPPHADVAKVNDETQKFAAIWDYVKKSQKVGITSQEEAQPSIVEVASGSSTQESLLQSSALSSAGSGNSTSSSSGAGNSGSKLSQNEIDVRAFYDTSERKGAGFTRPGILSWTV